MTARPGALLVAGTTSDAGKSVLVAGICRWLARQGVAVAPFKAQNMSLNSMVTIDGSEIGRAQAMQAAAAGIEPEAVMNPVLLKPGGDHRSQVVVLGRPVADVTALSYRDLKPRLLQVALECLEELRARFDVVLCEGAGSPAEINLRTTDIANMGLATAADLPVVVVGDIDRGGVFAALYGTLALLSPDDQRLIGGFVVNRFRGDARLLGPGLDRLTKLTGREVLGVVPYLDGLAGDAEDSLALAAEPDHAVGHTWDDTAGGTGDVWDRGAVSTLAPDAAPLRVGVVRLPRISNFTDADALAAEPGVVVRFATRPAELADADLVVLPGSRATVADLVWLRERGLDRVVRDRAAAGRPVLGICAGYQMLAHTIDDEVESAAGRVSGLALLPVHVRFAREKTLRRPSGEGYGQPVRGYEIHHGITTIEAGEPFLDGCRVGAVWGTGWHGALENDGFRREFLREVAAAAGSAFVPVPGTVFEDIRQARLDVLGDAVAEHLDTDALWRLIENGPPTGLPFVPPGA